MKTKHLLLLLLLAVLVPWAAKAQNQLNEGFESTIFPPEDWTTIHVSGSSLWTITTSYIHTGAASAYLQNDYPGHENYLVTPKLVPNTGESLSFYATCTSGAGTTLTIEVSTTTPTAAAFTTTLATYTTGMYSGSNYIGTNTQGTWVELTIPATALTSYVGQQIYIAFHVVANHYGANIWLDDVTGVTKYVSPTPKPRFLTSSNITHEDATLSWQVPATATPGCYLYNYKKSTDANWGPEGTVSNGTSVDITGLDALTEYQFRVKADYGTIGQSEYVETSFTTTDQPTVISDSWSNDFEGTNCGLTLVNGTINNAWAWGTATNNGGSHGLYISNNGGSTNFYNITQSSMVYAYKTLYLEAGLYHFLYDWKANGESEFDFLRVALIPASVNLEASTSRLSGFNYNVLPEGWIALDGGSQLNQNTNWQTMSQEVQVATGGEYKMVFAWRNDGGRGTNPPAAIDNIYIEAISCLAISNLINGSVSSTTATLQWTENGNATAWQICLNNDEEHLIDVTSNPFTLTNLIPGTTYTAKMRANCGNENYSHWSNEVTFIAASFHFDEDFESISAVPSGWTTDGGGSWTFDNRYHAHGEQSAYFRAYGNGNTNKLITPPMDLSQVGLVELSFLRHMDHMTLSMNNELNVYYRTSTNGTWMLIKQYTDDAPGWDTEYFILPNTTNCSSYQIAFEATDKAPMGIIYYGSDVCIDYVRIESVNYPRPNALSCPNIDIYTATLAWTENGNATAWQICLNDDEEHLIDATSTSFQLTNLSSGTTYTAKVRAVHGNDQSGWSYEIGFTTLEPDPTPVGLHCTAATPTTATLGWEVNDNSVTGWQICLNGDETQLIDAPTNPFTLSGLTEGAICTAKVRSLIGNTPSDWSDVFTFQTATSLPYATSFESDCDWHLINGNLTNQWMIGTATHNEEGSQALYISNDGSNNAYSWNWSKVYASKTFDLNVGFYQFSYDWKCLAEGSSYLRVGLVPVSQNLVAESSFSNNQLPGGWINLDGGNRLNGMAEWQNVNIEIEIATAATYKMVFIWQNMFSPTPQNPPAAIDNVAVTATAGPKPSNLHCTSYTTTSVTLDWTENGLATAWQICLDGDESNLIEADTNPFTLTNLTPNTTYTAKVRANYGIVYSDWSDEVSFATIAAVPYSTDFETDCDWNLVNGDLTNAWTWGTAAHNGSGTHGLYVSNDGGNTNAYNNTSSTMVYAYKTFEFEEGLYGFVYDWLANGESTWDFIRVALVPDTISLEASTSRPTEFNHNTLPNGWIALDQGSKLNLATEWQTARGEVMIPVSCTYKMVFAWRNDNSVGTNPPAAIDNVSITQISCITPSDLHYAAITPNTATLAWTSYGEATAWQICLNGDEANLIDVTENPYTLTNLSPTTAYTAKVRANCGEGDISAWSNEIGFTTQQIPVDLPYATDFETTCDWILVNGSLTNAWAWGEAAHNGEGTHGLYVSNDGGTTNAYTNTASTMVYAVKSFNFNAGAYSFSFDWLANGENYDGYPYDYLRVALVPDTIVLEASTSLPNDFSPNNLPSGWIALDGGSQLNLATEWQTARNEAVVPTAGTYKMVFVWRNDDIQGTNPPAAIDNVSITSVTCPAPTGLHIVQGSLSGHEVTMAWDNEEFAQYQYALIQNDFIPETITFNSPSQGNGQSHYNNLDPETSYTFFLRKYCSDDDQSEIVSLAFTTDVACPAPVDLAATEVYGYSVKLDWTASSDSYTVSYRTKSYTTGLYEQFKNDVVPTGWTKYSGLVDEVLNGSATLAETSYGWNSNSYAFGAYNMKVNIYGNNCNYWLVTPEVNVSSNNTLDFDLALTDYGNSNPIENDTLQADDRFVVLVYADGAWAILREWNNTGSDYVYNTIATTGEPVSIDLSAYVGKVVKIAFYGESTLTGNGDNDLHIDNVGIGLPIPAGEWQTVTVDEASAWLTDLIPEMSYEAKVQGDCGDDGLSEETAIISFTTIEACPVPTELTAEESLITPTTADLQWKGSIDVQSYTVMYRTAAEMATLFNEGFESETSYSNWQAFGVVTTNTDSRFGRLTEAARTDSYGFSFSSYHTATDYNQYLISPQISATGVLEFYYRSSSTGSTGETFKVGYSSTGNNVEEFTWGEEYSTSLTSWSHFRETIPTGTKYIAIHYYAEYQYQLYIDDITINIGVAPAGEWKNWTSSNTSYKLRGLIPNTKYEAMVQSSCSIQWSDTITFTTLPVSYYEDFEDGCEWTLINGSCTNAWAWGQASYNWFGNGNHGLYISNDDGSSNTYTVDGASSMVYAAKTFEFEAGAYIFSYDWKCTGEGNADFMRVALVPDSVVLEAGTTALSGFSSSSLPSGWIALDDGSQLVYSSGWQYKRSAVVIPASGTYNLVFAWTNNNWGGIDPPASVDNLCIEIPSCPFITDLHYTSLTPTTATLTWTENGEATDWQICLNGDEDNLINVTGNPYTLTGLTPITAYTVRVRANCGDGDVSIWSDELRFTTKQPAASIPYATGFENTCDWVLVNGDRPNAWAWGEAAHNGEGTHGIYISNDGGATNAFTFNEAISMVYATKTFQFEPGLYTFTYDWRAYGYTNNDFLRVFLVPDTVVFEAGTSFPFSGFYGYNTSVPEGWIALDGNSQLLSATEWQTMNQEVVVPTAGLYNMVFAWYNDEWSGDNPPAAIDNVSITPLSCAQPTHLSCTAITATTVTLSWTENYEATAWQICLNDDETNLIDVTENPYTLTSLTPETNYSVKVRAHCSEDNFSAWSDPVTFEASDKIVIGSGTASSSMFPTFVHNNYYQTQQIYTVDELGDAGNIVSIDYFMTTPAACQRNLDIYMVHTDAFAFQTPPNLEWIPVTAADLVFSGTVDFVNGWWTTITLDTPFAYDGQHNVAILVDDNTGSTINTNVEFLSYTATGYQSAFYFAGSTNVDPTTNTSYTAPERTKNQIRVLKQRSVTQTLNLSAGVNWVSFYVEITLDDLKTALLNALNNASGIKITSQNNGYTNWNGRSWRGSLNPFNVNQMYVIELPSACEISLEAMPIDPAEHPITLVNGPNWIGFPLLESMTLTNAFTGFAVNGDKVTSLSNGFANYRGSWRGGLTTLQPGQGYKYEVTTTGQRMFVFPTSAKKAKPFDLMGK